MIERDDSDEYKKPQFTKMFSFQDPLPDDNDAEATPKKKVKLNENNRVL
jgi:hypothetical protein